jgi:hypothetical protein
MAEFKSRYPELSFYVDGVRYKFRSGRLRTEDPAVIEALSFIDGVERVDEPKPEPKPKKSEEKPKKAAPKKKAAKKTSDK